MKLDKRIENEHLIYTPFTANKPKLHEKGYFTDDIHAFNSLEDCDCRYGELVEHDDVDYAYPYCCEYDDGCGDGSTTCDWFAFYIPESSLKSKEKQKQYRPFKDTREFFIKTNFEEGDLIHIRSKNKIEYWLMLVGWTNNRIKLGTDDFTFENLFENFELWDGEENFIPFGVEE
jgi:hypothetical protein